MIQSISFRHTTFIIIALAVLQFIIQMSLLTKGLEYAAVSLVIDDTYYYMQTAWNAKLLGFATFDGLHATNGVQLLWFGIIFLLALFAKTKTILLFATLTVCFLLNALSYLTILKIGTILKQPILALFMASLWTLQSLPYRVYTMGMENSLHALVYWCALWQSIEFLIRVQNKIKPNFWGLSIVLILNAWTRLDSALLSAILFTFCVGMLAYTYRHNLRLFLENHGKALAGSSVLAGMGLIIQLTTFRIMGDSFLPVSALVKTSGAGRGGDIGPIEKFVGLFTLGMPSIFQGRFPDLVLVLIGILGIFLVIVARAVIRDYPDEIRAFLNLWSCLLVGETIYHVYIMLSEAEFSSYFIWYRSPTFIFGIITEALLALYIFTFANRAIKSRTNLLRWAPAAFSLIVVGIAVYMFARSINFTSKLYAARYDAALWIAEHSPPDTVFASWNAGQLGFFSDRTFINLDGVINSVDYYERVLVGTTPLTDYLLENNVEYIVDYAIYSSVPDLQMIHHFPIDDGSNRSIQIWEVTPQISSDR